MKQTYKNYFQKSKVFLYPLLEIPKGIKYIPINTHISFLNSTNALCNYNVEKYKFFCLYHTPHERQDPHEYKSWKIFEQFYILDHKLYEDNFYIDDRLSLYMFDFSVMKKDIDNFRNGKYSKFSEYTKKRILDFFGNTGTIAEYIESYLYPKHYYELYSELLNVPIEILKETEELCDLPNEKKENFEKKSLQLELFK
tara:strand:+ start:495 stop:1085 length:591 start_codon:yes stop_codon:yes gene_type:complete